MIPLRNPCSSDLGLASKTSLLPKAIRHCGGVVINNVVLETSVANIRDTWLLLCFPPMQEESTEDI